MLFMMLKLFRCCISVILMLLLCNVFKVSLLVFGCDIGMVCRYLVVVGVCIFSIY